MRGRVVRAPCQGGGSLTQGVGDAVVPRDLRTGSHMDASVEGGQGFLGASGDGLTSEGHYQPRLSLLLYLFSSFIEI